MQDASAAPREGRERGEIEALIAAHPLRTSVGADILGLDDEIIDDLSGDLISGSVSWAADRDIHRTCQVQVSRPLRWDRDRIRPWLEVSSPSLPDAAPARFWLGVFVVTAPVLTADDSGEPLIDVYGIDKLHLLGSKIGDTWAVEPGEGVSVGGEVQRLLAAAGYQGRVAISPALFEAEVPGEFVWAAGSGTTWLRAANDLLAAAGAGQLWTNQAGTLTADPLVRVQDRPVEWTLDAQAPRTLVSPVRRRAADLSQVPNAWRCTAANWGVTPTEGDGLYLPADNSATGETSITARGRRVLEELEFDAISQEALVAQAEERRARDMRAAGVRDLEIAPLPLLGHHDVFAVRDVGHGDPVVAVATAWTLNLDGSDGPLTLEEVA